MQEQPEVLFVRTTDGWDLALHLWRGQGPKRFHPILAVHGLAANRLNIDLDARHSVARAAQRRGFDVYVLELRGSGRSKPPEGRNRLMLQWGFREHSKLDLPVAVKAVLEHSGAKALHGLGHSMGGMLFYAFGVDRPPELHSLTTVAAPMCSQLNLAPRERRLIEVGMRLAPANALRRVPVKQLLGVAGRFITITARVADGLLLNAANCDHDVMARVAREGIADIPLKLMQEMWIQMGKRGRPEPPFEHEARLDQIDVPVQVLSGSVDRIAPFESVEAGATRLQSRDVRYRKMGIDSGDRADYGHADLLVGKSSSDEVYPFLVDFIEEMD